jgi:hypothetical protein
LIFTIDHVLTLTLTIDPTPTPVAVYENADSIVGIYRDKKEDCSHNLTLDLTQYGALEEA